MQRPSRRSLVLITVGSAILIVAIVLVALARQGSHPVTSFVISDPGTQHVILNTSECCGSVRFYSVVCFEGNNLSAEYARYGVARQWLLFGEYVGYQIGIDIFAFRDGVRPTTFTQGVTKGFGLDPKPCMVGSDCYLVSSRDVGSIMAFAKAKLAVRIVAQKRPNGNIMSQAKLHKLGSELLRSLGQAPSD